MRKHGLVRRSILPLGLVSLLCWAMVGNSGEYRKSSAGVTTVTPLKIKLSTPGRIGFYVDYSERKTVGKHTFYVCRTHGTKGAVSVTFKTSGDPHKTVQGTIAWADGEADIKSFTVTVTKKSSGEHRITAQLSAPTGGAVLHFGEYTRAYGVIDDNTIAPDSLAVFYDAAAKTNGNGSQAKPYNSIYDAIKNIGTKRYLYGKGTTTVDGTNKTKPGGAGEIQVIFAPKTRTSEKGRLYIRNWPGHAWVITGGKAKNRIGFYTRNGASYHTYKGIQFIDLDASQPRYTNGAAIFYHYGGSKGINIEQCYAKNINGAKGCNNGAWMVWGVDGVKVWRSVSDNMQTTGETYNQNTAGVYTYSGKNISVQRCEMKNSYIGVYQKRTAPREVSPSARFNIFHNTVTKGVFYGASGSSGVSHSFTIVQGNLFLGNKNGGIVHHPGHSKTAFGVKHWWVSNVFVECARGEIAAIEFRQSHHAQIFNNIVYKSRKVWADVVDSSKVAPGIEFADYNHEHGTTLTSQTYELKGKNYTTAAALTKDSGFAKHDTRGDPKFVSVKKNDYHLKTKSPCRRSGVSKTDKGIYLTGIEVIGAGDIISRRADADPEQAASARKGR